MSKKKSKSSSKRTKYERGVSPEFKKQIKETNEKVLDLGNAPDELRLSNRLLRMIDPYIETMDIIVLIDCATIAWNECVQEDFGSSAPYSVNNMLLNFAQHRSLIDELKSRKRQLFKNNSRHIKQVKVYQEGDDISVNVASSFDLQDAFSNILKKDKPDETSSEDDDDLYADMDFDNNDGDTSVPNPRLKHILLTVVDNQLRDNVPPITRETFERLQAEGYTPKQAKEKIAAVLIENIYEVFTTKKPHDAIAYEERLRALK